MTEQELAKMDNDDKIHAIADALDLPKPREDMDDGTICKGGKIIWTDWNPLTNANARDEVVEAMAKKGWSLNLYRPMLPVETFTVLINGHHKQYHCRADTPGEAVLNACLLAIGE